MDDQTIGAAGRDNRISDATTARPLTPIDLSSRIAAAQQNGWRPHPYQILGAEWLQDKRWGLLFDACGVGKTPQALLAIPAKMPTVVVAPKSVQRNWAIEAARWRPDLKVREYLRRDKMEMFPWPYPGELLIVRWSTLSCGLTSFYIGHPHQPVCVILDEAHRMRNGGSAAGAAARDLAAACLHKGGKAWALTGTPVLNRPEELRSLAIGLGMYEPLTREMPERPIGAMYPTYREILEPWILRRTIRDVLPDLPAKIREDVYVPIHDGNLLRELDAVLQSVGGSEELEKVLDGVRGAAARLHTQRSLISARTAMATAKIPFVVDAVEALEKAGEPVVVTSAHRGPIAILAQRPKWAEISGAVSNRKRIDAIRMFQAGELRGIGLTLAGVEGITLTRSHEMLVVDQDWRPGMNLQWEGRLFRAGQHRQVHIRRFVAEHEVERVIARVLARKVAYLETLDLLDA